MPPARSSSCSPKLSPEDAILALRRGPAAFVRRTRRATSSQTGGDSTAIAWSSTLPVLPKAATMVAMGYRFLLLLAAGALALAQSEKAADAGRPPLLFREDFKETPAATPITQDHLANPNLVLGLYGPGRDGMKKSHHDQPADDPYYIWDGGCAGNCAAALRDKAAYADLTGLAKVRWRTKQSGFRRLHIILKLATGAWLVSDAVEGESTDWRETEAPIHDLRWRQLDIRTLIEGAAVPNPDLGRVDEIGWTTLMTGGNTPASSRVDWIEVYGRKAPRNSPIGH